MSTASSPAPSERPSLLPDAPTRATSPAAAIDAIDNFRPDGSEPGQKAAPTQGQQPPPAELPPYEHPFLEKAAKGKYRTLEEYGQHVEGIHKEMKQIQTAKAALEMRLGQFKGPPVGEDGKPRPYDFKTKEGSILGPIDPTSPEFEMVQGIAGRFGAPEEMIQELFTNVYEPIMEALVEGRMVDDQKRLIEHYGTPEATAEAMNNLGAWLSGDDVLGEEGYAAHKRGVTTKESAQLIEALMHKFGQGPSLSNKGGAQAPQVDTWDSIGKMQRENPNWRQDPALTARWRAFEVAEAAKMDENGRDVSPLNELRREHERDSRTPRR